MHQQVGSLHQQRDIGPALGDDHALAHSQPLGQRLHRIRPVFAHRQQPGVGPERFGQGRQTLDCAIQPLPDEGRADHQHHIGLRGKPEFVQQPRPRFRALDIGEGPSGNAGWDQVKTFVRGAVPLLVNRLFPRRKQQDLAMSIGLHHGFFARDKKAVTAGQAVQAPTLGMGTFDVAGIRCVIGVQPRHAIEPDHQVGRICLQLHGDGIDQFLVALVIEQAGIRQANHLDTALGKIAMPLAGVDLDGMPARHTVPGDAQHVALGSTVREVFEDNKSKLHQASVMLPCR